MNRILTVTLAAALACSLTACEKKEGEAKSAADKLTGALGDAAKSASDAASSAVDKAKDAAGDMGAKLDDMVKGGASGMADKMNAMIAEWKPTVESLKGKVASAPEAVKPQIEAAVKGIEAQWQTVEAAITKIKGAPVDQLKSLGGDAMTQVESLGTMIKDAAAKYLK
ncbi:MAG: hypothetical protein J0L61_10590 [Planctomycetes bacterium]|nr:hypothetical protein [Planctomycetota bacterium]